MCHIPFDFVIDKELGPLMSQKKLPSSPANDDSERFEIDRIFNRYLQQMNKRWLRRGTFANQTPVPIYFKILFIELDYKKDWEGGIYWTYLNFHTATIFPFSSKPKIYFLILEANGIPLLSGGQFHSFLNSPFFSPPSKHFSLSALSSALQSIVYSYLDRVIKDLGEKYCRGE